MKNFKWWQAVCMALLGAALTGCGSNNNSSGSASLRVANATLTHSSLNVLVNGAASVASVTTDTVSASVSPAAGSITLQVNDTGSGTALNTIVPTLTGGLHYTLLAYESAGAVKTVVLGEDYAALTTGSGQIHFYDAAPEAGRLDVYVTASTVTDISTLSPTVSYTTTAALSTGVVLSPGTYKVWVTGLGNKSDLRLVMPSVVLADTQNAIVVLTPASGGVLLNGSTLVQQSTYTAFRNTSARVRLAAAVSGNFPVAAFAGSVPINTGSVSPALSFYAVVPATNTLNISVNGNSIAAPTTPLTAGADSTLLVYGSPTNPTVTLLTDDNRAPTDGVTAKVRLINGVTGGNVGAVTMTANGVPVGQSIDLGMASGYVTLTGSTTTNNDDLVFTSSLIAGNFFTATTPLFPNTVYTVLLGDKPGVTPPVQALVR